MPAYHWVKNSKGDYVPEPGIGTAKNPNVILDRALDDSMLPATAKQYRYIALLSSKLNKQEPHVKTRGEAGRLIGELKAELKYRTGRGV